MSPGAALRPTNLHVAHFWGGGTEGFVEDFATVDSFSDNLVLQSLGTYECYGLRLRLVHPRSGKVLDSWVLRHPISEVRSAHDEYAAILETVCIEHAIDHLYVSSLVGHSLDVFRLGIPSTKIYHDYFPYCPAFFITRDGICTACSEADLGLCRDWPTSHRPKGSPGYYQELRDQYFAAVDDGDVRHVCASRGLPENLRRLDSRFEALDFDLIEHGIAHRKSDAFGGAEDGRRLRVGLLGLLGWNKGRAEVRRDFDVLRAIADLHIIGAKGDGAEYEGRWGSQFVHHYSRDELPGILECHRLDLVLFLPLVPETFSYTLSEAWCFCVPPAARNLGAYAERMSDGEDGFLIDREDGTAVDFLLRMDRRREELRQVARRLRKKPVRTVGEAVLDYYRLRADYPQRIDASLERGLETLRPLGGRAASDETRKES